VVRRRGRAGAGIDSGVDLGGGVGTLGWLRGRAGAGSGAAAEDVFVGVALGAGRLAGAQRSIYPRQEAGGQPRQTIYNNTGKLHMSKS
jgi:hypothetical protein